MVVPALKVFACITEFPTLTGTSRIIPEMVERICVLLASEDRFAIPSLTISRLSWALRSSSCASFNWVSTFSYSSRTTTLDSYNSFVLSKTRRAWVKFRLACVTLDSAAFNVPISGITLILAMISPTCTIWPASLYSSDTIPDICGTMATSSLGSTFPVATVFCSIFPFSGTTSSYTSFFGLDFFHR